MVLRDKQVLAYCELSGLADPCDAKRWHIADLYKKSLSSFSLQPTVDVKRVDGEDRLQPICRRQPSFRSSIFAEVVNVAATPAFAGTYSHGNKKKDAPRKGLTFSVPIKKKMTPYMRALEKIKLRKLKKSRSYNQIQ